MERALTAKGAATKARIIEGAVRVIRELGPARAGLDDVRAATSTSKSQLFHYFPDGKSDLLIAVARYEAEQVLADQQPLLGDLTTWPKWEAWQRRVIEIYDAQRQRCPLSALTAQLGVANPETRAVITDLYDRWQAFLTAGLEALKQAGEIDRTIDSEQTAAAVIAVIAGGATMLQATDRLGYLEAGLTDAVEGLRRPRG